MNDEIMLKALISTFYYYYLLIIKCHFIQLHAACILYYVCIFGDSFVRIMMYVSVH